MCLSKIIGTFVTLLCGVVFLLIIRLVLPDTNFDSLSPLASLGVWLIALIIATAVALLCIGIGNAVTDRLDGKHRRPGQKRQT